MIGLSRESAENDQVRGQSIVNMKSSWSVCEFVRWGKIRHMPRDERKAILGAGCLLGPAIDIISLFPLSRSLTTLS